MNGEYVSVAENEKHATFWGDVAEKRQKREEAAKKQQEQVQQLQRETQRLAAELQMQTRLAQEEKDAEAARRHQEHMISLQIERDRLAAELAKQQQRPASTSVQYQEYTFSKSDYETLKKTVYGQASNEPREAQMAVAFVVLNRARANRGYWGGSSINDVCRKPGQFSMGIVGEPEIYDWNVYNSIDEWLPRVLKGEFSDLTHGADHFLPHWETGHDWLKNVDHVATFGSFNFYKSK